MRKPSSKRGNLILNLWDYFFCSRRSKERRKRWIYYPMAWVAAGLLVIFFVKLGQLRSIPLAMPSVGGNVSARAVGSKLPAGNAVVSDNQTLEVGENLGANGSEVSSVGMPNLKQSINDFLERGYSGLQVDDKQAALASFIAAAACDPSRYDAWRSAGMVLLSEGYAREALELFNRAISLKPYESSAYSAKAVALRLLSRLPEAIMAAAESVRLNRLNPLYSNVYYFMRIENGEVGAVEEEVRIADKVRIESIEANTVVAAGAAALYQGKLDEFRKRMERAEQILPKSTFQALLDDPVFLPFANEVGFYGGRPSRIKLRGGARD